MLALTKIGQWKCPSQDISTENAGNTSTQRKNKPDTNYVPTVAERGPLPKALFTQDLYYTCCVFSSDNSFQGYTGVTCLLTRLTLFSYIKNILETQYITFVTWR